MQARSFDKAGQAYGYNIAQRNEFKCRWLTIRCPNTFAQRNLSILKGMLQFDHLSSLPHLHVFILAAFSRALQVPVRTSSVNARR